MNKFLALNFIKLSKLAKKFFGSQIWIKKSTTGIIPFYDMKKVEVILLETSLSCPEQRSDKSML